MAKIAHGGVNVFNISEPHLYRCQILHYHARLSRLYIAVYKGRQPDPAFYLLFPDVGYISAPMSWSGANFAVAPRDACLQRMLSAGLIGEDIHQFPDAYAPLTEYTYLYTVDLPRQQAQIIAGAANLLQQVPADL